jgi:hypothetical protein
MPINCVSIAFQELAAFIKAAKPRRKKGYTEMVLRVYVHF